MRGTKNRGRVTTSSRKIRVSVKQAMAAIGLPSPAPEFPTDAPEWNRFPGSGPLRAWARELRQACSSTDAADDAWELTGRAAIVVGSDATSCAAVLRRVAADAGMRFISIVADDVAGLVPVTEFSVDAEDVCDLAPPAEWRRTSPLLVHLERGRWMLAKGEDEDAAVVALMLRFQSRLASWIRAFDREHPVVIVTTADDIRSMAESLRQVGLFDRFMRLPSPTMEAQGHDFIERVGREHCAESITQSQGKVGKLASTEYEDERRLGLAALQLRRLVAREKRQLEFIDLVNLSQHGFAEADELPTDSEGDLRQFAYHEAGHAVMAVIDSAGHNVPEYSSIIPSAHYKGVVVQSYSYLLEAGDLHSYADLRHKVRISLAGRAAEELVFGAEHVCSGATEDLTNATERSGTAFALWGFAPSMEKEGQAGSNLAVVPGDGETITPTEHARVEGLVRKFLAVEYRTVKETLSAHRPLLDAVADRLMKDAIVDQDALAELVRAHVPALEGRCASAGVNGAGRRSRRPAGARALPSTREQHRESVMR
jgi:cell division protease FtsH